MVVNGAVSDAERTPKSSSVYASMLAVENMVEEVEVEVVGGGAEALLFSIIGSSDLLSERFK